jgi:hypothetical protein
MLGLFNTDRIENTEINIYFKYNYLDTAELSELFGKLDKLYNSLLENSYPVYFFEKYDRPFRNFLEIESINTGKSITIKFKEGWKPEFRVRNNELEINIPVKLGIPAIVLYFLLTGAQRITTMRNDYLDGQLKDLEIQVKRIEFFDKMERREMDRELYLKNRIYQKHADDTIKFIINNQSINYMEINGIVIKEEQ